MRPQALENRQGQRSSRTTHEKSALLAESPRIGRIREDISPGLSMFPFGDYLIFYDIIPNGIWVVHVIHGARDVRRVLALKPIQP